MSRRTADEEWTPEEPRGGISRLAFVLLTIALLVALGYNTFYLARERQNLRTIRENQQAPLRQAERVRAQFDSIVKRTLQLAQQGNPNASMIVESLARRGITVNPGPAPQTTAPDAQAPAPK